MSATRERCCAVLAALIAATTMAAVSATDARAANKAPGLVAKIKVLPNKAPDCSSLKSIVESITRDCKTNDEKAVAIYNFMQLTHYHFAYPGEPGGLPVLKEINCYGWSLCGGLHSEQSALWRQLGWDWRFVGWNGHTTVEANYDGKWHYLDVFLKFYAWKPDPNAPGGRTIASEDELTNNSEELIRNAFVMDQARKCVYAKGNEFGRYGNQVYWLAQPLLCCGDTLEGVIGGLKTHHRVGPSEGWAGIVHDDRGYSADVNLAPGFALTNTWDAAPDAWYWGNSQKPPAHTCGGHKDTRNDPGIGLVLYVEEAHEKAPMQVAAVILDAPFEPGQPYDFAKLGQNVGSTIVQQGTGGPTSPPKRYEIDVTRAIRAWAGGTKCHGLGVRIVPNRGVDDGWTVRCPQPKSFYPQTEVSLVRARQRGRCNVAQ